MDASTPRMSRSTARLLVALVALVALGLNLWQVSADLPAVLHSDYVQIGQAVDFLRTGRIDDRAVYPLPIVYFYAAGGLATYAAGHLLGGEAGPYSDWSSFVQHLSRPEVHHTIGRSVNAVFAALLAVGAYRLARVRFDRRVAVLAAALACFSPLLTIYSHQVRPHIPVIALTALTAPAVLRAALRPSWRIGLLAGLGTGLVSAVFQAGLPFAAGAAVLALLVGRPWRALPATLGALVAGFFTSWVGLFVLTKHTGLLAEGSTQAGLLMRGSGTGELGGTELGYGIADIGSQLGRFALAVPLWAACEIGCALGLLGFLWLCLRGRRRWLDLFLYGVPASGIVAGICFVHLLRSRYTMYATPFMAPLAASACLAIPAVGLRRLAAAGLVLASLLSSIRHDVLLGRTDTRMAAHAALSRVAGEGLHVVIQADIVPTGLRLPPGASLLPPHSDYRAWLAGTETPAQSLLRAQAQVFVRPHRWAGKMSVSPVELAKMGYALAGQIGNEADYDPDDPGFVLWELWTARQPGPQIDWMAPRNLVEDVRAALAR